MITMFQKEFLLMMRYRIGDITSFEDSVCGCAAPRPDITDPGPGGRHADHTRDQRFPVADRARLMSVPELGSIFRSLSTARARWTPCW